jgi:hypothetical protein
VQFISDEDIVISAPQELDPFPGLAASANAIFSDYPEPASLWLPRAAPPVLNPAWEAEDGGRRLPTSLNFPACARRSQVAQLMAAYAKDARRFRVHRLVLPPEAFLLEPLDTIAWTSARNGYAAKIFEVVEIIDQPGTINQELLLRERDPGDYSWSTNDDLPEVVPVTGLTPRPAQLIEGWSVVPETLRDATGNPRRPAIRLSWTGTAAEDANAVRFEIRLAATAEIVASGLASREAGSLIVSEGLLPATAYQARARYLADRPTDWSSWLGVTTPAVYISEAEFENGIRGLFTTAGLSAPEIAASLPATGAFQGQLVFLTSDNKLYRWTGSSWSAAVQTSDLTGTITGAQIAAGTITGDKITANTITGGLLATSGIITQSAQIGDALITSAKIGNLQVERIKIATGAVTTFNLIKTAVTYNGQTTYGSDNLIGIHSVGLAANSDLVPERIIFRPRFSGYLPVVLSLASGQFGCYYRIRIKRNRAGTITDLGTYIEPFWQFVTDGTRMTQVLYAGVRPTTVVQITQTGSYQAGDTLIFEFYWHRFRSGSVNAAVEILSYDLEVEEYFR